MFDYPPKIDISSKPGCPEFAFSTISAASTRIVFTPRISIEDDILRRYASVQSRSS